MSDGSETGGLPDFKETERTSELPVADCLTSDARGLAFGRLERNLSAGDLLEGDAATGASILSHWARTARLFDGRANAAALQNYKDRLDPQFVVALEWAQQDPDAIRKFLDNMQGALG